MPEFEQHFTVEQANALVPQLQVWFAKLRELDRQLLGLGRAHRPLLESRAEAGLSGHELNDYLIYSMRWRELLGQILETGVQIKDLDRGLCDFPHLRADGTEVFLCWESDETKVSHWHSLDEGYTGRRPL